MFIKLCGFTRIEDIEIVKNLPISSVGFIFYKNSRRYISPEHAGRMALLLKKNGIKATGVFVDDDPETIMEIVNSSSLDMVQVYNSCTADALSPLIPVINCVRIGDPENHLLPEPHTGGMVLFDTYSTDALGGTGKSFNLDSVIDYPFKNKMIIAGGISENNIYDIIRKVHPGGIDISSGIEISAGIKSEKKILRIMQIIEEAQNDINA